MSSKKGPDGLTDRQRGVLEFIKAFIAQKGFGPTVREIGLKFDIMSPNGVMVNLAALVKKGKITRDPNISRGIKIVETPEERERTKLIDRIKELPTGMLESIVNQFC